MIEKVYNKNQAARPFGVCSAGFPKDQAPRLVLASCRGALLIAYPGSPNEGVLGSLGNWNSK